MRYNRYAMPVHPKVLEKDFENTVDINTIPEIYNILKGKSLSDLDDDTLKSMTKYLEKAWNSINYKKGVNLRDREKLAPVFQELNRILFGRKKVSKAYRGVRLSNFDPNALSRTFPNSINDPEVLEHLEGLAYGLRSWILEKEGAEHWANSPYIHTEKDMVILEIKNPVVVLDSEVVIDLTSKFDHFIVDTDEVVLNIKNPKILKISPNKDIDRLYHVVIRDMG